MFALMLLTLVLFADGVLVIGCLQPLTDFRLPKVSRMTAEILFAIACVPNYFLVFHRGKYKTIICWAASRRPKERVTQAGIVLTVASLRLLFSAFS